MSDNADSSKEPEKSDRDYLDGFLGDDPAANAGDEDTADAAPGSGGNSELEERVVEALRSIFDPEIPVNIYDLGLIYKVEADASDNVVVTMTLTTPHCPVAESMPGDVERRVADVEGISAVTVNLVWDPPWDPSRMTEEAQLELGFI